MKNLFVLSLLSLGAPLLSAKTIVAPFASSTGNGHEVYRNAEFELEVAAREACPGFTRIQITNIRYELHNATGGFLLSETSPYGAVTHFRNYPNGVIQADIECGG